MRDWTKAMAALLAAVSSVGIVQISSGQESAATQPATPVTAGEGAVRADEADPFVSAPPGAPAPVSQTGGRDLSKEELKVSEEGTVEIHVSDANLIDVLRNLSMQTRKNIITSKSVGGKVTANLYNVTVREALDSILHANGFAYREKGNFIYVYTVDELKKIEKDERKFTTQIFKLNYTPAAVAAEMLRPAMSADATVAMSKASAVGLPTSAAEAGGNSYATEDVLVITDYEDNIVAVRNILKEMDRRPQQVLVEATILAARLSDNNSMGVDFALLGGVDFATLSGLPAGGGNVGGTKGGLSSNVVNNPDAGPIIDDGYNGVNTNLLNGRNGGLNIGVAYNNVAVFVNALESITDTTVLANPKVLTVNKQAGAIIVGSKDGYLTSTSTSTTTVQTVEFLETGTRLIFRPFIADDGFIRMEVHPEDSTGSVEDFGDFALPRKQTTEVTANILVKDGHTIVIGGLFREDNTISRNQVPFLGNIPLAGYLFRSQSDIAVRQEVIILLTPHIIKDHESYSEASADALKYTDMMRVGSRQGMMPWSRDRLAEMSYKKARDEMSEKFYDRDRAMWYLDCATNLNPGFAEALAAKQQVSGEVLMESDNSSIRHFLADRISEDRSVKVPAEPVSTPVETPAAPEPVLAPAPVVPAPAPTPAPAPAPEAAAPAAPAAPAPEAPAAPAVE